MIEQGTEEWRQQRCGKVTASRIADVTAKIKTGYGISREHYMTELIIERLTGRPVDQYVSAAMRTGTEREPDARAAYEYLKDTKVELVGFVPHPTIADAGASPDGYVGTDGAIEIKCPNMTTHVKFALDETPIPDEYIKQMQWGMACTGRQWCDYVSYDPIVPVDMRAIIKRVERDDVVIHYLTNEVVKFIGEVERKVQLLSKKFRL